MKYLKYFESSSNSKTLDELLRRKYGADLIDECDEVISHVRFLTYDLHDAGFHIKCDYAYSTNNFLDITPKIELTITAPSELFLENEDFYVKEINSIGDYLAKRKFAKGEGWREGFAGLTAYTTYHLLFQK
jgi:hypothetical protein